MTCNIADDQVFCNIMHDYIRYGPSISLTFNQNGSPLPIAFRQLLRGCIRDPSTPKSRYLTCTTILWISDKPSIGQIYLDRDSISMPDSTSVHASHMIGIFFQEPENELEYLVYVLFAVDGFLLTIITGYLWNKRYEIVNLGINNFLA